MSGPKVEQIDAPTTLGEGPHWDQDAQALYYVDIRAATIHKYVPSTNKHTEVKIGMY
jgi:sugar lactone lactonase YvrE